MLGKEIQYIYTMKKIGFIILAFVVNILVYCVFSISRLVKAPLWWIPLNDYAFYVRSRETNQKQKQDEGIITQKDELMQDLKWFVPTVVFTSIYYLLGAFWLIITIGVVALIGIILAGIAIRNSLK